MKTKYKILSQALILSILAIMLGCSDKDSANEKEVQLRKLTGTWSAGLVTRSDEETTIFENFDLTFSGTASAESFNYTTSGRPALSPWPAAGAWVFGSSLTSQIIRDGGTDDELIMNYTVDGNNLAIEFTFSGEGYSTSRANSPDGTWRFEFTKQ
jgi:hypothetical protein